MDTRKVVKVIIGTIVLGAAAGYLLYQAAWSSLAYCCTVDEFVDGTVQKTAAKNNCTVRLVGQIKADTIVQGGQMQLDFQLAGQKNAVPVQYNGMMPNNFTAGKEIFVEGKMGADGVFQAQRILTRCESKYKSKPQ